MNLGLRTKLTLAITGIIVVFAGVFALYFPAEQAEVASDRLRSQARSISLALSTSITPSFEERDLTGVNKLLKKFKDADSDIVFITIVKQNGLAFTQHPQNDKLPADVGKRLAESPPQSNAVTVVEWDNYVLASAPVYTADSTQIATLTTALSLTPVSDAKVVGRATALIVSAIILIFGVIAAWLLGTRLATPILKASHKLDKVSNMLVDAARDQEASSAQEAAAVAETRRSMETLLNSAQQIADRSSEVLGNAERSANGSRQIAGRIGDLNELSEKVADILATIMQVADKADLLALNASLEGTRAGEAGKGFALVAAEMRRLAENVMESVAGIRELMKDIREASQAAVAASGEGTKSSTATTRSAREIALLTQEQRAATEQVIASMDEMGDILKHTLDGIQRTTSSAQQLTDLASTLSHIVSPSAVQLGEDALPSDNEAV